MTTREEIEAAVFRWTYHPTNQAAHDVAELLVAERAERQRRIEAAVHRIGVRFMTKESEDAEIREIITRCLDGETT